MPSFKHKTSKRLLTDTKNITTLDSMHKEKQAEFNYIKTVIIPKLENERNENKELLKSNTCMTIEDKMEKHDRNIEITATINKHNNDIKNYYLSNNKYIFSYFETKKEISNGPTPASHESNNPSQFVSRVSHSSQSDDCGTGSLLATAVNKAQLINSFFKVGAGSSLATANNAVSVETETGNNNSPHHHHVDNRDASCGKTKHDLYKLNCSNVQQYFRNNKQTFFDYERYTYRTDLCAWCGEGEMVPIDSDGMLVCNKCSNFVVYYMETDKPSYKEPPKEACFYAYKRINHFREIIAQFQAKETTQIDPAIISAIENQIRKERITLEQFTDGKAKEILKKLGYNKYYEHIPFIKDKLGIKPPVMSPELEETLCNLFMEIQGPYARFCPDQRVNFLNYYYTIYKLCELLGQTQFLPYFPMLKDRDKRIEQDEIWKKICKELKWIFIPTQ
jgi:hypothetical protein